jgi:Gpi18-like mannosyltransferase
MPLQAGHEPADTAPAPAQINPAEGGPHSERVRSALLDWPVVGMILAIKAMFYIYGTQAFQVLRNSEIGGFKGWLEIWNRWDAVHYINLAQNGYQSSGDDRFLIIFYPLFPWLTRIVALVFGNYIFSALVVAGVASVFAGLLLRGLLQLDYTREIAERSVWFMFIFPGSAALHLPYTESLLLALILGSFLAARTDRWALAGILGALACLSRINGLVLIPALIAEAGQEYWLTRRWRWQWLWIGVIGFGILGYLFLNQRITGDPFMFMTYRREHWFQILSWPWTGIWGKVRMVLDGSGEQWVILGVQDLLFIILGLVGTVWACIKLRPSYAVWMVCNWLLFTSTGFITGVSRFAVVMFPLYLLFSRLAVRRIWHTTITVWSLLFLALFTGLYVEGHWIF